MSSKISAASLQLLFAGLGSVLRLPLDFFVELLALATNFEPVTSLLQHHRLQVEDECSHKIQHDFTLLILAQAYYLAGAIVSSRSRFSSRITVFFQLNENFHDSNIFHKVVDAVIRLLVNYLPFAYLGPMLVARQQHLFVKDRLHLSHWGSKRKAGMLKDFFRHFRRGLANKDTDIKDLLAAIDAKLNILHQRQAARSRPRFGTAWKPYSAGGKYRANLFEKQHYPYAKSGKKLAIWDTLHELKLETIQQLGSTKLYIMHGTSMQRDLISPSPHSSKERRQDRLLGYPGSLTVSPGATGSTMALDLRESPRLEKLANHTYFMSVFYIGTNEKLELHSMIVGYLCNQGLITTKDCPVCERLGQRNSELRGERRRARQLNREERPRPPHQPPKVLTEFERLLEKLN